MSFIVKIAGRVCKDEAINSFKVDINRDPFESKNLISPKDIIFNEELQKELLQLSEKDKGYFLTDVHSIMSPLVHIFLIKVYCKIKTCNTSAA